MNEEHTWTGNSEVDAAIVMLDRIDCSPEDDSRVDEVEATLRRQHARIQELEAMLEAVGAGGASAQRVTQAKWTGALRGEDCKHEVFDDGVKTMIPRNPVFVRITHIPTGVTVECRDDERSSHRNSANAWLMLEAKLKEKKKLDFSSDPAEDRIEQPIEMVAAQEPFGYFKAEPFGWRDCADTDEGAIALYEAPQPQAAARDAERWRFIKRKLYLTGNGDGTCAMQALNLPARILGWPDVGELAIAQFLDAAIDAAIAAAKGE